jgi:hypothetical protein
MITENSSFYKIHKASFSAGFAKQIMLIFLILCYNGSFITSTAVSMTAPKFKPRIFSVSVFAVSYAMNMAVLII